ncbi:hypothetical protein HF521_009042, partial [Silurus meridionalis]
GQRNFNNKSDEDEKPNSPELSQIPMQTSHSSYGTRRSSQKKQPSNQSAGDGRFIKSVWFLRTTEKLFLEDMLSDNPRYLSNSQLKPSEYWEEAAATLPEYQGPWRPALFLNTL